MATEKTLEEKFIETGEKLRRIVEEKIRLYQDKLDTEKENETNLLRIMEALEDDVESKHLVLKMMTKGVSDTGLKMLGDALKSAHEVVKIATMDLREEKKADKIQKERDKLYEKS